jgi:NADPH-dependent ferric siderophore reductase
MQNESSPPVRRVERVRHEVRRRELEVLRVEPLGPGFLSLTFGGEALEGFVSMSFDDHVKFFVDDGAGGMTGRDYTPRAYDAGKRELTIEFALHGEGAASDWARQARVGSRATIGGPRGSMIIPTDYAWHLLIADDTALPAVRRRLEELPADARVTVLLQVEAADRLPMPARAGLDVQWLDHGDALVAALQALPLPAGEGFVWAAGEASVMARLRRVLQEEKAHPKEAMRVAAYWKRGASGHHENLE